MTGLIRILLFVAFLLSPAFFAYAQTPQPKNTSPAKGSTTDKEKAARDEAKRLEEQRRATAITLLLSVADEARGYRDQTLRARIQSRSADLLWDIDVEKARVLFRRAWEAAETADTENERRFDEQRLAQERAGRPFSGSAPPSLRSEILRAVALRDRKLGEELLARLDDSRKQAAANASTSQENPSDETDPYELPPGLKLRLRMAQQLLDTDVERAVEFADPGLTRVSVDGLVFLSFLRAKNPVAADERYAAMLAIAGADMTSDANAVSLLSSYIFTPFVFVRFSQDGDTNSNQYNERGPAADVAPELRLSFLRLAEQVFLRPLPPPEQDHTTSGRVGKYLVMQRMLPYFQQYATEQSINLMRAQFTALAREIPESYRRNAENTSVVRGDESEDTEHDSIESILKRLQYTDTPDERDNLFAQAALIAMEKDDPRAFDFADSIENSDTRKSVRAYVDFNATRKAIDKKRLDDGLKLARTGALSNVQRVWALIRIGNALVKSDRVKTIELLDEAASEARRIGGSSADRPRALVGVATTVYVASRGSAWELMSEVVRSANNTNEEFSGEDARIVSRLETKNQISMMSFTVDEFDLPGIFRLLAKEDLQRAILLAKDFNGESPRATALVAIVREVLSTKSVPAPGK